MDHDAKQWRELQLDNLRAIKLLGNGALGTVFLVYDHLSDPSATSTFALKVVEKSSLQSKHEAERRSRWEVSVLSRFRDPPHPFLPTILGSFETQEFFGWAVPFCPGGDLNVLRYRQSDHVFSPSVARFYLAEIVCALEHLHSLGIVYRDLKPENILIQQSGHVTLTDFDLSRNLTPNTSSSMKKTVLTVCSEPETDPSPKKHPRNVKRLINGIRSEKTIADKKRGLKKAKSARVSPVSRRKPSFCDSERSYSFVGTEEYVAPEVVRGDGHEFAVDWWALGVLSFEMLYGTTPFRGKNRKETFQRILMAPPAFIGKPNSLTDLIGKLLQKDPTRRLGYRRGAYEIKEHEFFRGLNWDLLTEVLRTPFLPLRDETDSLTVRGIDIREHFLKLKVPPSPLWSPSRDDCERNVSLAEF